MTDAADLGVEDAAEALARRELSSRELVDACLERIGERDGAHSHEGDPGSINAWVRVYEEDAREAAARADERLAQGDAPTLCGIPIGLKDLYAVAGKPLTASSTVLYDVPDRDCDIWARLAAEGMVLLGHVHTHEFACGGTTDQVGNPWALERSAGGSGGGSSAALASRQVPAATGTDTAGSLRIPSAECGTSTIKPTRGSVSMRGVVPARVDLRPSRADDPNGRRLRARCSQEWRAWRRRHHGGRFAATQSLHVSPCSSRTLPTGWIGRSRRFPASVSRHRLRRHGSTSSPTSSTSSSPRCSSTTVASTIGGTQYRPSNRGRLEHAERRAMTAEEYIALQVGRTEDTNAWCDWFAEHRIDAIVEPTIPIVAPLRGSGYDEVFGDVEDLSLTHYWDWTGFPVVSLPSGVGRHSGLPVSVSLVGAPGADWDLLDWGASLQNELGTVTPP